MNKEFQSSEPTENLENKERLGLVAKNIIDCFGFQPEKESLLVLTDDKVIQENGYFIDAIKADLDGRTLKSQRAKGNYEMVVVPASPKSATPLGEAIGEKMKSRPVLIITSMSRSHSRETGTAYRGDIPDKSVFDEIIASETFRNTVAKGHSVYTTERLEQMGGKLPDSTYEKMKLFAQNNRSRIISITKGHNPYEILTRGAVEEPIEKIKERASKVSELMKDVKRVHITSPLGTDIWLNVRPDLNEVEDGNLGNPGSLSNYPIGEWSCSPDWEGSNGVLVIDGPCGGNINQDIIDEGKPFVLTVKQGEVIDIKGDGKALDMWKSYLDSGNNDKNHAYRLAEFAVGTNTKALQGKPRSYWGSTEGEKVYGTAHIAVGSNGSFGRTPDDPNYNSAAVHCDMVLGLHPNNRVTVECERKDSSRFNLINNGEPKEY